MIYLLTFWVCFLADEFKVGRFKTTPFSPFLYYISVLWIYIFLCFGYMTGSDWKGYELMYDEVNDVSAFELKNELGFVILLNLFKYLTSDFWIFNGVMKILYLWSIVLCFGHFTNRIWTVVGLSFSFSLLFMIIDCPMRFMISQTCLLFAIHFIFKKNYILTVLFCILSIFFHQISVVVIALLGLLFFSKLICKINVIFVVVLFIIGTFVMYSDVLSTYLYSLSGLFGKGVDSLVNSSAYGEQYSSGFIFTIGFVKNVLIIIFLLYCKRFILSHKYGELLFSATVIGFAVNLIVSAFPTGFRIGIIFSFFTVTCIVLICSTWKKPFTYSFYSLFLLVLISNLYGTYVYIPYTNSIPYILTEHLSYEYRELYNISGPEAIHRMPQR